MVLRIASIILLATIVSLTHGSVVQNEVPDPILHPVPSEYHRPEPGIQVQSGSVSYLLPDSKYGGYVNAIQDLVVKEGLIQSIKIALPKVIKSVAKSLAKVAVTGLTVIAVGASVAAVVFLIGFILCEFTQFCFLPSIGSLPFSDDHLEETVRGYMAPDKLAELSNFVINSIVKYSKKYKKNRTA